MDSMSDMKEASSHRTQHPWLTSPDSRLFTAWLFFFTYLLKNSCMYVYLKGEKMLTLPVSCAGLDRGAQSELSDWEFSCWWLPCAGLISYLVTSPRQKSWQPQREVCALVCVRAWWGERLQCQSLTLTHRGQTNALIRSWHAATTFSPSCPVGLSLSPLSSSFFSSAFFQLLCLSYSPHRRTQHICSSAPFSHKARHRCKDSRAGQPNEAVGFKLVAVISM